jgi:hypothetical protein
MLLSGCRPTPRLVPCLLQLSVSLTIAWLLLPVLLPIAGIFLLPGQLTLLFVYAVIRIRLLFFPLPFALSGSLTSLGSAVSLIFYPWVSWQNPSATGTTKCASLHSPLHDLKDKFPEGKNKKKRQRKK